MDSKLTVALCAPCFDYIIGDSLQLNKLFTELFFLDMDDKFVRLYKKYVKCDDLLDTASLVERYKSNFKESSCYKSYVKLIEAFRDALEYAETECKEFGSYQPFRLELLNLPYRLLNDKITLEDYDNNEEEPFWMRPEYILEHYSRS